MKSIHYAITTLLLVSSVEASEKSLLETYGDLDLAKMPAFQGDYINFGYWRGIAPGAEKLTRGNRIQASEALYELVAEQLQIQTTDRVLEVGAGQGNGVIKIATTCKPALIIGIDITPQQISRARQKHGAFLQDNQAVGFAVGAAGALPVGDESCTKVFSVEAAQCFPSMQAFAQEAWRVLKPGGKVVVTAHFATNAKGYTALQGLIPSVAQGIDRLIPIQDVRDAFAQNRFKELSYHDIGGFVFEGFEQWRASVEDVEWGGNIVKSYRAGHMGYYLIVLEK